MGVNKNGFLDLISNLKMFATNGGYPPKSPLRLRSGQALPKGDF